MIVKSSRILVWSSTHHSLSSSAMCHDGCRCCWWFAAPPTETRRSWDRNSVMSFSGIDLCVTPGDSASHGACHQTGGKIKMNSSFEMQMWNVTTWCQQPHLHLSDSLSLNLQMTVNIKCTWIQRTNSCPWPGHYQSLVAREDKGKIFGQFLFYLLPIWS